VAARGLNGTAARTLLPPLLAAITRGEIQDAGFDVAGGGSAGGATPVTCIPLAVGARTIGALGLGLPDGGPFSRALLPAIAAHIAAAVDTARTAQRVADIGAAEERRRIAREMHDGLAQTLANALLQSDLSAITAQSAPADVGRELRELRSLLEQAIREMREFMAELRRTDAGEDRLFLALDRLTRELERRHHQAITLLKTGDDAHLPPAVRHAVLAIARQALANVQTHARATAAAVRATVTDELCTVSVTDNGIGFDVHAYRAGPQVGHHLGLPSMEERASLVGGRLVIESQPNGGTTVTVQVPLGVRHG
jgi:signal transduction histidine kinase